MVRLITLLFSLFVFFTSYSQSFEPNRITDWENAGLSKELIAPTNQVRITDFGADHTGAADCNTAYADAIASLNGGAGAIYFPPGEYLFTTGISIPDSVFLKGESSETQLIFNLGGSGDLIRISGTINPEEFTLVEDAVKGTNLLELADVSEFEAGDVIRLYQFDEDYMFSSWAYETLGQVIQISEVNGTTLVLEDPLNHNYPLARNPYLKKLNPRVAAGIECLTIIREDATPNQTDNIHINHAFNCVIRNLEIENSNFAHIAINSSAHILVEGCYMHHAHAYGGGGQGYGVVTQVATSFCLTQNNIFNHLRHSMLIQSGANGNVFGYNYSYDPYWESGSLPQNSAGDAVLHGNYTYLNLFEGNTVQNIVVDASHGSNGPFNTFFRNRAELYGFFSDFSTPTDSMNVVGNEITNSGFPLGLYMVNGVGHYTYGNNVSGATNPSGTSNVPTNSLYLDENNLPEFLAPQFLPMAGYPLGINDKLLAAEERFLTQDFVSCSSLVTSVQPELTEEKPKFLLHGHRLILDESVLPATVSVYSINGALVQQQTVTATSKNLLFPNSSEMLLIRVESQDGLHAATFKHLSFGSNSVY